MGQLTKRLLARVRRRSADSPLRIDGSVGAKWVPTEGDRVSGLEDRFGNVEKVNLYVDSIDPKYKSRRISSYSLTLSTAAPTRVV